MQPEKVATGGPKEREKVVKWTADSCIGRNDRGWDRRTEGRKGGNIHRKIFMNDDLNEDRVTMKKMR